MSLEKYKEKRNFSKTGEPKGSQAPKKGAKQFVIQYHQARSKHYDFRLEHNGVLLSWAVPKGLSNKTTDKRLAVMVEDHPIEYASFEGTIPKGNYGAGEVKIYDKGVFLPLEDFDSGLKKGHLKFLLNGEKYKGGWDLIKAKDNNWLIIKSQDEFAGKEIKQKGLKNPFSTAQVELALLSEKIPKGKDWIFEIKYDGYRILSYIENGKCTLVTRNGQDYSKKFPKICDALVKLPFECGVLDGEMVVFDQNGRSDFGLLQERMKNGEGGFYYIIFDILALNGEDLRGDTLKQRKSILEKLLKNPPENLILSSYVVDKGQESFNLAKKMSLEGIVAKKLSSKYLGKRSGEWLKIKCYQRQEFVIGGYVKSEKNPLLSALLVGYYQDGRLIYAGKVGSGLDENDKKNISQKLKKLARKSCPFDNMASFKEDVVWVTPKLIAEISYSEMTKSNLLRQPSFLGLREDKSAKEVKKEGGKR